MDKVKNMNKSIGGFEIETTEVGDLLRIDNAWICEHCEDIFLGEYFSAEHCNVAGEDLVLCEECCIEVEENVKFEKDREIV